MHDPLFVEANVDRSACVHIANGALQRQERIKCTRPAFCIFLIIASLACDCDSYLYITFAKLNMHVTFMVYYRASLAFAPFLSEAYHIGIRPFHSYSNVSPSANLNPIPPIWLQK